MIEEGWILQVLTIYFTEKININKNINIIPAIESNNFIFMDGDVYFRLFENQIRYYPGCGGPGIQQSIFKKLPIILEIFVYYKKLQADDYIFYTPINIVPFTQKFILLYMNKKIRMLENQIGKLNEYKNEHVNTGSIAVSKIVTEKQNFTKTPPITNSESKIEYYKKICSGIARENQYYKIIIIGKNSGKNRIPGKNSNYILVDNYFCVFQKTRMVFEGKDDILDPDGDSDGDSEYFKMHEDDHFIIYISGIKEPNVYEVIDLLKLKANF